MGSIRGLEATPLAVDGRLYVTGSFGGRGQSPGAVYPALGRLRKAGLIAARGRESGHLTLEAWRRRRAGSIG